MRNVRTLPNDSDLPFELGDDLPSLGALIKHEPRGATVDKSAAIAKSALDVPALPGASEANEREAYRQRLVAANRALNGFQFNTTASGAVAGLAVASGLVLGGIEGAVVVGLGMGAWKVIKSLAGRR
jgi:hypothetical protein